MGTRNLTAVYLDGQLRVAQYGQWDGYPSGQGAVVLGFLSQLSDPAVMQRFKQRLRKCRFLNAKEIEATWKECGAVGGDGWVTMEVGKKHGEKYPALSRDTGAGILQLVLDSDDGLFLDNEIAFAQNSLFCEYAYVIDLDAKPAGRLEFYRGFNKAPVPEGQRFAGKAEPMDGGYYAVRMAAAYPLDRLPTVADLVALDEREEETTD